MRSVANWSGKPGRRLRRCAQKTKRPSIQPPRHWIASLTLAMTTPRCLASLIAKLTPKPAPPYDSQFTLASPIAHSSLLIRPQGRSHGRLATPTRQPYPSSLIVHTLSLIFYFLTLDTLHCYLLYNSCVTDALGKGFKRVLETFFENYLKFDEKFAIMLYIGVKKFYSKSRAFWRVDG
jgi:hypothetical protein